MLSSTARMNTGRIPSEDRNDSIRRASTTLVVASLAVIRVLVMDHLVLLEAVRRLLRR